MQKQMTPVVVVSKSSFSNPPPPTPHPLPHLLPPRLKRRGQYALVAGGSESRDHENNALDCEMPYSQTLTTIKERGKIRDFYKYAFKCD